MIELLTFSCRSFGFQHYKAYDTETGPYVQARDHWNNILYYMVRVRNEREPLISEEEIETLLNRPTPTIACGYSDLKVGEIGTENGHRKIQPESQNNFTDKLEEPSEEDEDPELKKLREVFEMGFILEPEYQKRVEETRARLKNKESSFYESSAPFDFI